MNITVMSEVGYYYEMTLAIEIARTTLDAVVRANRITAAESGFVWNIYNGDNKQAVTEEDMLECFRVLDKIAERSPLKAKNGI